MPAVMGLGALALSGPLGWSAGAALMGGVAGGMSLSNAIGDEDDPSSSRVTPTKFTDKGLKPALVGDGTGIGIQAMANAAAAAGHKLTLTSGTRSNAEQLRLFTDRHDLVTPGRDTSGVNGRRRSDGLRYYDGNGGGEAGWYSLNSTGESKGLAMPPGASKHQTGDAADLGPAGAHPWIAANAARFGLKNPTNAQGAKEPWHVSLSGSGAQQIIPAEATAAADSAASTLGVTGTSASYATSGIAPVALPQGVSKASAPAVSSGTQQSSVSASVATTSGNTITIAPSITLAGTGSDAVDAQNLANKVIKIIETSDAVQALRTS